MAEENIVTDPELLMLINNRDQSFKYREKRHEDWRENYELYRDKVTYNRLTQRQTVNLPIMKTAVKTLLKDIDDMPVIEFENRDNNAEAQIFLNEVWKVTLDDNNAEIQDLVDKKQECLYGRTFDSWQVVDGKIKFDIEDTEDMLVDRFTNPYDLDSARFLIHLHIFKPLSSLKLNKDLDQVKVAELEEYFKSQMGIVKANDNLNSLQQKNDKLRNLGVTNIDDPILGETYVELSMHFVVRSGEKDKDDKIMEDQIFVYVEGEQRAVLMKKPQEEILGVTTTIKNYWRNHYRYNSWAEDVDKQDFWTDGIADTARTPNKIVNSWFSQLVENRTLRNFGMHYYDSSLKADGFAPSTFNPVPWGWYPVPGKPSEVLQKVDIPDLSESLDEMNYVVETVGKATATGETQQGEVPAVGTPLGSVQLAQVEAKKRTQGIAKFYTHVWKQRALKFAMLLEASADKIDVVTVYKKGRNTSDLHPREVSPKDYLTKSGYNIKIWSQAEKETQDSQKLEKMTAVGTAMADNPIVMEGYKRKLLEFAGYTPDEINQAMEFEKKKTELINQGGMMGANGGTISNQPNVPIQQPVKQLTA